MKRRGYRGVGFEEAERAVAHQRYERMEKRQFAGGIQARSIFGPGLYLISDPELAAQYAFCHAEVDGSGRAAVLRQDIQLEQPFVINCQYSETQLRQDALEWKYRGLALPNVHPEYIHAWLGRVTKDYLLAHSFDSIVYHVDDTVIYYVAYFPEKQIEHIYLEFAFTMNGV